MAEEKKTEDFESERAEKDKAGGKKNEAAEEKKAEAAGEKKAGGKKNPLLPVVIGLGVLVVGLLIFIIANSDLQLHRMVCIILLADCSAYGKSLSGIDRLHEFYFSILDKTILTRQINAGKS